MAIDAMDILYTKHIDTFCIVTSDCDFTPLATRILSEGKSVIGFGERKTPSPFVNACSTFLYLEEAQLQRQEMQLGGYKIITCAQLNGCCAQYEHNERKGLSFFINHKLYFGSRLGV